MYVFNWPPTTFRSESYIASATALADNILRCICIMHLNNNVDKVMLLSLKKFGAKKYIRDWKC